MDSTRIMGPMGGAPGYGQPGVGEATQIVSPGYAPPGYGGGFDPARTAMAAPPFALSLQAIAGNQFAQAARSSTDHALFQIDASGVVAGRRTPDRKSVV